jgi:hypothetical protein
MRAETRPEGREAVESVQVSGWAMGGVQEEVAEYQAWNWWMGEEGCRSERERAPLVNWLICSASWGVVSAVRAGEGVGATVGAVREVGGEDGVRLAEGIWAVALCVR